MAPAGPPRGRRVTEFDPQKIFEVLHEHEIDFVVIGAMAAVLQGAALTATFDVDIAAATSDVNRTRLASALRAMDARLRLGPGEEPVKLPIDERILARVSVMTFQTKHGRSTCSSHPRGRRPTKSYGNGPVSSGAGDSSSARRPSRT